MPTSSAGQPKTPPGIGGSAHSARATARARAGLFTVIWSGNAICNTGTRATWLRTISRPVTGAVARHRAARLAAAGGLAVGDDAAAVSATVVAPTPAAQVTAAPCNCVQKEYTQDQQIVFRDICTNQVYAAQLLQPQQAQVQPQYPTQQQ